MNRVGWRLNTVIASVITSCVLLGALGPEISSARQLDNPTPDASKEKVILDTDIGMDIDDAFAIALALRSPELNLLGFSTASGDTTARAKIIDRILSENGRSDIPVVVGPPTTSPDKSFPSDLIGLQRRYGEHGHQVRNSHPAAVDFILGQIRQFPGQITLVTIGPLSNVGALIDKDAETFRKLKRVVMMGGWIRPVADQTGHTMEPLHEYNIFIDVHSAQKLFASGVSIYMIPVDSTMHLALDEVRRRSVFSEGTSLTDTLALLYILWGSTTPVLFDAMAVAYTVDPQLCPVEPMHLVIDDQGYSRETAGAPNAQVCLHSDANTFLNYYVRRVLDLSK